VSRILKLEEWVVGSKQAVRLKISIEEGLEVGL
jgi:hypothetical protein